MEVYCIAWGERRQVEAYLYGGNEVIGEYERAGKSPVFLIQCAGDGGFGVRAQSDRFASGSCGGGPYTLESAEEFIKNALNATPRASFFAQPGKLSRPSGLAERVHALVPTA